MEYSIVENTTINTLPTVIAILYHGTLLNGQFLFKLHIRFSLFEVLNYLFVLLLMAATSSSLFRKSIKFFDSASV